MLGRNDAQSSLAHISNLVAVALNYNSADGRGLSLVSARLDMASPHLALGWRASPCSTSGSENRQAWQCRSLSEGGPAWAKSIGCCPWPKAEYRRNSFLPSAPFSGRYRPFFFSLALRGFSTGSGTATQWLGVSVRLF